MAYNSNNNLLYNNTKDYSYKKYNNFNSNNYKLYNLDNKKE